MKLKANQTMFNKVILKYFNDFQNQKTFFPWDKYKSDINFHRS